MTPPNTDTVTELNIGCVPELAISGPYLLATDERLVFCFNAMQVQPDGRRTDAGRAVVKVPVCWAFKFGYPNDEALPGHPLYSRGFHGTAVYEVSSSSWLDEMGRQNRVRFPNFDVREWNARHFLFSFHESTLEILGSDLEVTVSAEAFGTIAERMQRWLHGDD